MSRVEDSRRGELIAHLQVLGEVDATQTALFQQAAAATYGLGITEMKALSILVREGPRSAGQLADGLHLTSGAVTGVVDRLVRRGLARRTQDERDRRKVVIEADLATLGTGENVYRSIGDAFAHLHAGYTTEQLEFLARHLEASIGITKRETEKLRRADRQQESPAERKRVTEQQRRGMRA
jgi:DNA-binding MarR family transcriptional regulator